MADSMTDEQLKKRANDARNAAIEIRKEAEILSARLEVQRRSKMTPEQVADEIAGILQVLHPAEAPAGQRSREYAEAWINAGGIICLHGLMIVDALRSSAKHPGVPDADGQGE